jgi:hypothetical protein
MCLWGPLREPESFHAYWRLVSEVSPAFAPRHLVSRRMLTLIRIVGKVVMGTSPTPTGDARPARLSGSACAALARDYERLETSADPGQRGRTYVMPDNERVLSRLGRCFWAGDMGV